MVLRLATWNVNSLRRRLDHLARFAAEAEPDLICLQETKVTDAQFPRAALQAMGYPHLLVHGQKGTNGVAILSRLPFKAQGTKVWCGRDDRRHAYVRLPGGPMCPMKRVNINDLWYYRYRQAFARDYGCCLDHVLVTPQIEASLAGFRVVRETRAWDRPSDHVPLVLDLE